MQCNIDARGRRVRLIAGLVTLLIAAVLLVSTLAGPLVAWLGWGAWVLTIATAAGGAFAVYEGWAGWCAVRAMGWRTPV